LANLAPDPLFENEMVFYFDSGVTKRAGKLRSAKQSDADTDIYDYHGKVVTLRLTAYFGGEALQKTSLASDLLARGVIHQLLSFIL
jgi:hypothetical protein